MKKILVPYDFSQQALNALHFATRFHRESKAEIHLLNVVELPVLHDTLLMPTLYFEEEVLQNTKMKAEQQLEDVYKNFMQEGIKLKTKVEFGDTSLMILDYIRDNQVDEVVMGTKGASGVRELFVGSNTEKIVRTSPVPVIAVKKTLYPRKIKNVVFPNNLETDASTDLVSKIKTLQHTLDATLHIVWINTPVNFRNDLFTREDLEYFVKEFKIENYTLNIFNDVEEEAGIINFSHAIEADMVALGTHGRKGLAHLITGSLAEDLVNHLDLPVWTYTIKKNHHNN